MSNVKAGAIERAQWMSILQTASEQQPDEISDEWIWLMEQLGLPLDYFAAVQEAIRQGRWRNAKNPRSYVKVVAQREAKKDDPLSSERTVLKLLNQPADGRPFSFEKATVRIMETGSSQAAKRNDGVWRRGAGWSDAHFVAYEDPRDGLSYREFLLSYVPRELKKIEDPSSEYKALISELNEHTMELHFEARPSTHLNWDSWATRAGFDVWDRLVLRYRTAGIGRDRALEDQLDGDSRKALQAAWRKFDRTGFTRLKEAAEKSLQIDVPE